AQPPTPPPPNTTPSRSGRHRRLSRRTAHRRCRGIAITDDHFRRQRRASHRTASSFGQNLPLYERADRAVVHIRHFLACDLLLQRSEEHTSELQSLAYLV